MGVFPGEFTLWETETVCHTCLVFWVFILGSLPASSFLFSSFFLMHSRNTNKRSIAPTFYPFTVLRGLPVLLSLLEHPVDGVHRGIAIGIPRYLTYRLDSQPLSLPASSFERSSH